MAGKLAHDDCLDNRRNDPCHGDVLFHSINPGVQQGSPRCDKHWAQRLDRRENSLERYADSPIAPVWFDPAFAGERWNEDD